jgi:hypothetical protein
MLFDPGWGAHSFTPEREPDPLAFALRHGTHRAADARPIHRSRHRFQVGARVSYTQTRFPNLMSGREGIVVRQLPTKYFGPEYLLHFPGYPPGFIAGENELTAMGGPEQA